MSNIFRRDMNGIPYSYPSLELENAEIAKVCQEISTNYSKYEGKAVIMHRSKNTRRFVYERINSAAK